MADEKPTSAGSRKTKATINAALRALSQIDLAFLINRPVSYIRENTRLFIRDGAGQYDGQQAIAAVLHHERSKLEPAKLSDDEYERVLRIAEQAAYDTDSYRPAAIQLLSRIVERADAGGLAAIGRVLLDVFVEVDQLYPRRIKPKPTAGEIRAECAEECERRIRKLDEPDYDGEMRVLTSCGRCPRFKYAGKWRTGVVPSGFVLHRDWWGSSEDLCPTCEAKTP